MFAYCENNPLNNADSNGNRPYNVCMTDTGNWSPPPPVRTPKLNISTEAFYNTFGKTIVNDLDYKGPIMDVDVRYDGIVHMPTAGERFFKSARDEITSAVLGALVDGVPGAILAVGISLVNVMNDTFSSPILKGGEYEKYTIVVLTTYTEDNVLYNERAFITSLYRKGSIYSSVEIWRVPVYPEQLYYNAK